MVHLALEENKNKSILHELISEKQSDLIMMVKELATDE